MVDYSNIWKHLSAYRLERNMMKKEMAKLFNVKESQYGKLEAGTVKITYEKLQCFEANGGDIYYIFTGCRRESGPIYGYVSKCKTKAGKEKLLDILIGFIELGTWLDAGSQTKVCLDEMPPTMHKCIRLMELEKSELTLWNRIRNIEALNQIEMAEVLEIDVKYYRALEKDETLPKVEVLYALFNQLHYSPQLFFDREKFYLDELNHYWNRLSKENQVYLDSMINSIISRIVKNEC